MTEVIAQIGSTAKDARNVIIDTVSMFTDQELRLSADLKDIAVDESRRQSMMEDIESTLGATTTDVDNTVSDTMLENTNQMASSVLRSETDIAGISDN